MSTSVGENFEDNSLFQYKRKQRRLMYLTEREVVAMKALVPKRKKKKYLTMAKAITTKNDYQIRETSLTDCSKNS